MRIFQTRQKTHPVSYTHLDVYKRQRMCSLHKQNPSFGCIKVVHFNALGAELQEVQKGNTNTKKAITKKLVEKHGLSVEDAAWLIDSVHFEKVNLDDLELNIQTQISEYVPVMSAPTLAKELLIHHISCLLYTSCASVCANLMSGIK